MQWRKNGKTWENTGMESDERERNKMEVIADARNKGITVHFASLMDLCHLKNLELESQFQMYEGREVVRSDIVKDDSGSYAVFTEQGSSASQITPAIVMDIFRDLPDAQDKQLTQYLITPRSKWKIHRYWKFQSQNVQIFGYVYQNTNGPIHGPVRKIQSSLLNEICTVILWQDHDGKGTSRKFFWKQRERIVLVCVCGRYQTGWETENIEPTWKILMRDVDLGEPTSFLDHVYLGCTQRECQISRNNVDSYRNMFESRMPARGAEKMSVSEKSDANISSWSYDMEGHAKKFVERNCELANKTTEQLYKVSTPCMDDHQFKKDEMGSFRELSKVCSQIVLKCLYMARIGRPDILWSVNKFARSITKWTKACGKRLNRLISYIHHTCEIQTVLPCG